MKGKAEKTGMFSAKWKKFSKGLQNYPNTNPSIHFWHLVLVLANFISALVWKLKIMLAPSILTVTSITGIKLNKNL